MPERNKVFEIKIHLDLRELLRRIHEWRYLVLRDKKTHQTKDRKPLPEPEREFARIKFVERVRISDTTPEDYLIALRLFAEHDGFRYNTGASYRSSGKLMSLIIQSLDDKSEELLSEKFTKHREILNNEFLGDEDVLKILETIIQYGDFNLDFEEHEYSQVRNFLQTMFRQIGIEIPVEMITI